MPITVLYDAVGAGGGAFGLSQLPTGGVSEHYADLSQLSVLLRQYASTRADLRHDHVSGHTGVLGNELADALARTARNHRLSADQVMLPHWPARFARHSLRHWAWAMVARECRLSETLHV